MKPFTTRFSDETLDGLHRYWSASRVVHVLLVDSKGTILSANSCFCATLKRDPGELIGSAIWRWLTEPDCAMFQERLRKHEPFDENGFWLNIVDADQAPHTLKCWYLRLGDDVLLIGEIPQERLHVLQAELMALNNQLAVVFRENVRKGKELAKALEELKKAYQKIANLAFLDPLTEVANRRKLEESFQLEVERASRLGLPLTAVLLDIDHFKSVNDAHGHAMGDRVLQRLARAIVSGARPYDLVARYGGEEFLILMPGTSLEQGRLAAERFRSSIASMRIEGLPHLITASFGVATLKPGEPPHTLFDRADKALYCAKEGGRNRVCVERIPQGDR